MAFPLTIDGTVKVKIPAGCTTPEEVALSGLMAGLKKVNASTIRQQASTIVFTVNFLRLVWNTNLLIPVEDGTIDVRRDAEKIKITYRLGTFRLFFMISAFTMAGFVIIFSKADLGQAAKTAGIIWGWMFGASYLLTLVRFRWFAWGKVRDAFDRWAESGGAG